MPDELTPVEITPCEGDVLAAQQLMRMCMPGVDWTQTIAQFLAEYCQAHWFRWEMSRIDEMRDRLDRALVAAEADQAARGRAINATQYALASLERARDALQRAGMLDEAACVQRDIGRTQELAR